MIPDKGRLALCQRYVRGGWFFFDILKKLVGFLYSTVISGASAQSIFIFEKGTKAVIPNGYTERKHATKLENKPKNKKKINRKEGKFMDSSYGGIAA